MERSGQAIHVETLKGQLATGGARGFGGGRQLSIGWHEPDEWLGCGRQRHSNVDHIAAGVLS